MPRPMVLTYGMELSAGKKKWLKIIIILLSMRVVLAGIEYYVLVYRSKEILQYVVNKETNGLYQFEAEKIEVHLFKKAMILHNASLLCTDTLHPATHFTIRLPTVYLSITNMKDLIFHQKISIDSMAILSPDLAIHTHHNSENKPVAFQASQVLDAIQQMATRLQIRTLRISDGAFSYGNTASTVPFRCTHLNFYIRNFSKKDQQKDYLLSSEDIDLNITGQHWQLPDGQHEIAFKNLHFSGAQQIFSLDSCEFYAKNDSGNAKITLHADRIFFKARRLQDVYASEILSIDTLRCIHPALYLETAANQPKDTNTAVSTAMHLLLKQVHFKYIDITDGQLALNDPRTHQPYSITRKANVQVYNLRIRPNDQYSITTDSIRLKLNTLQFMTSDSLYQLSLEEFSLINNDLIFNKAVFGPTPYNHHNKGISFTSDQLYIHQISLEALLRKKLKGSLAALYRPQITMYDRNTTPKGPATAGSHARVAGTHHFYRTLHDLQELIAVDSFQVVQGSVQYHSTRQALDLRLKNMNGILLLNHFLRSDSLIDVKRALPHLQVGTAIVTSPKFTGRVDDYVFEGGRRQNHASQLQLFLPNKTTITGKKLYWELMDWDQYANHKAVQVADLHAQSLQVKMEGEPATEKAPAKPLPEIVIGRIDIDEFLLEKQNTGGKFQLQGHDICIDDIQSDRQYFTWGNAAGNFSDIHFKNKKFTLNAEQVTLHDQFTSNGKNMYIVLRQDSSHARIQIPEWQWQGVFQRTDLSALRVNDLIVNDAAIQYSNTHNDTLNADAVVSLRATALQLYHTIAYDSLHIHLKKLNLHKNDLDATLASSQLTLTKGSINDHVLQTGVQLQWKNAALHLQPTDSTKLAISGVSGQWNNPAFTLSLAADHSFNWHVIPLQIAISKGNIQFENKKFSLHVADIQWNGLRQQLALQNFDMAPRKTKANAFATATWQADYMTVQGKTITLQGLQLPQEKGDSTINVHKIILDAVSLQTARDKRIPFRHGIEKLMPAQLIQTIRYPLQIDSVEIKQSNVTVQETPVRTNTEGTVPITDINGYITHLTNRYTSNDSLRIVASAFLSDANITRFEYREAYHDSLSGFRVNVHISPLDFTSLNPITIPMAALQVQRGQSDTLFADWTGNKYAAIGHMNFYYRHLKVKLLDPKDTSRSSLKLTLANLLANAVLRNRNTQPGITWFVRDREKFVFNYWVKTTLSGIMPSVGVKRNRKYLEAYQRDKAQYSLTAEP